MQAFPNAHPTSQLTQLSPQITRIWSCRKWIDPKPRYSTWWLEHWQSIHQATGCFHGALCSQRKANWLPLLGLGGLDETSIRLRDPCLPSSAATTHATRAELLGIPVSSVKSHQLAAGQDKFWRLIWSHEILKVDDLSSDMEHDMAHTSSVFPPAAAHSFLHHAWPPCSIDLGVAEYILKERTSSVTFPQDMETGLPTTLTLSSVIEKAAKIPHSCTVRSS